MIDRQPLWRRRKPSSTTTQMTSTGGCFWYIQYNYIGLRQKSRKPSGPWLAKGGTGRCGMSLTWVPSMAPFTSSQTQSRAVPTVALMTAQTTISRTRWASPVTCGSRKRSNMDRSGVVGKASAACGWRRWTVVRKVAAPEMGHQSQRKDK